MIQANPDGPVVAFAALQQFPEQLPGFLMAGMEVAGVDADFLHHGHYGHGYLCGKVDIGHQRHLNALAAKRGMDALQGLYVREGGDRNAD